jgi:hypothetical protein
LKENVILGRRIPVGTGAGESQTAEVEAEETVASKE